MNLIYLSLSSLFIVVVTGYNCLAEKLTAVIDLIPAFLFWNV